MKNILKNKLKIIENKLSGFIFDGFISLIVIIVNFEVLGVIY